jgi:predicted nicotinamide N-methyase
MAYLFTLVLEAGHVLPLSLHLEQEGFLVVVGEVGRSPLVEQVLEFGVVFRAIEHSLFF